VRDFPCPDGHRGKVTFTCGAPGTYTGWTGTSDCKQTKCGAGKIDVELGGDSRKHKFYVPAGDEDYEEPCPADSPEPGGTIKVECAGAS